MVLLGAPVEASREALGRMPVVGPDARRSARRAAVRWAERGLRASEPAEQHRWRRDGLALWRGLVAVRGGPPVALGRCQAALDDVLVRDAVLLDLVPGHERLADRVVAGWNGPEIGTALRAVVDPGSGVAPPERAERAAQVLRLVVGHRPRAAVPALTLLAVCSRGGWVTGPVPRCWSSGRSPRTRATASRASSTTRWPPACHPGGCGRPAA